MVARSGVVVHGQLDAQPGQGPAQPGQVTSDGEGGAPHDLEGLEHAVAHGEPVVEGRDRRGALVDQLAVDGHDRPARFSHRVLASHADRASRGQPQQAAALSSVSAHSPDGVESQVTAPPVPKWIWPSSSQNVRMATFRSPWPRSASTQPTAPQYTPRSTGSRRAMWSQGGQLRRARHRSRREGGGDGVRPSRAGAQLALDRADQVHQARVGLDVEQVGDPDRAPIAHPAQVVAHQVDDHHVLGPVLGQEARRGWRPCP